ncbi:LuxR C-terminal-related transcriptional regulator [Galactobacter valiniphilus]|uniref:LuxR C-terminal-related transcriptional regulator n=1 Tax=Galactobacter valiniphilus TaxID=2676122 RepID=UPI003736A3C1
MSAPSTQPRLVVADPDLLPTREVEAARAARLLEPGHSVVLVGHPGEGRSTVAREVFQLLGVQAPASLRCSRRTTAAQLLEWFDRQLTNGFGVLEDAEALSADLSDLLEDLVLDTRLSVLLTADAVAMRSEASFDTASAVGILNDLWRRRFLDRVDLGRLPFDEARTRVRSVVPPATFDALQEATLTRMAGGSLALARDMAEDMSAAPESAPRFIPRAWSTGYTLSARTLHRIAARFRDQSDDLYKTCILLHQVGPLEYSTAARLFGPELISGLESCGALALLGKDDFTEVTSSSALAAGLLSDHRCANLSEDRERLLEAIRRLVMSGVPVGDSTALVLARWLVDSGKDDAPELGPLFVQAASKAVRHGWPAPALTLTKVATALGLESSARPVRWQALMLEDRHEEVLAEARELAEHRPEALDPVHVHRMSAAASWLPHPPAWLVGYLRGPLQKQDPALSLLMRILLGDAESTTDQLAELEAFGHALDQPTSIRLSTLALCITRYMSAGQLAALERCIQAGRGLRGTIRGSVTPAKTLDREAKLLFDTACSAAQVLAGLDPAGVERVAEEMVQGAISIGPDSGRFPAASAAYLQAIIAYNRGDAATARVNIAAAMQLLDRTTFATSIGYMAVLSLELASGGGETEVDAELLGEHLALTHRTHPRLTSPVRTLAEAVGSPVSLEESTHRPGWAVITRAHQEVLAGRLSANEALAHLPAALLEQDLPASKAQLRHLQALASGDPEELLDAAAALTGVGKYGAARHALAQARQHFLAHRQTARANDCAERLGNLPIPDSGIPGAVSPAMIPAGLTQREYEVCLLVGEGLTNPQISERLFLSVRTVESHVLQARAKLRAPRRKDIPERLLRIMQGRG